MGTDQDNPRQFQPEGRLHGADPQRVRAGYVDTSAELGHWLEICQLQREEIDFFTSLIDDSA